MKIIELTNKVLFIISFLFFYEKILSLHYIVCTEGIIIELELTKKANFKIHVTRIISLN